MPFVNIPDGTLSIAMSRILGRIKADLKIKVLREVGSLEDRVRKSCGNLEELEKLQTNVTNLQKTVVNYKNRILKIQKSVNIIAPLILTLNRVLNVLLFLPIPNTTTTAGSVVALGNQLHKIKELIRQLQDDINVVTLLLAGASNGATLGIGRILNNVESSLNRVNSSLQFCIRTTKEGTQEGSVGSELPVQEEVDETNRTTSLNEKERYTSNATGLTFVIEVIVVDESQIAPLRQAIAKDLTGVIRFSSDKSYSSSTQVLIDEVKYKIEANIN